MNHQEIKVYLTIDVEQDCPPYLKGYRGIEEGLPRVLNLLKEEKTPATFFVTGEIAKHFPAQMENILRESHELGCHGLTHERFDRMSYEEANYEIKEATQILRKYYLVTSFRAPNLQFPEKYLPLLEREGYRLDSSLAKYKITHRLKQKSKTSLTRVSASITSSALRLPRLIRFALLKKLKNPVVLFIHPWELIDLTQTKLRWDCRFKTGEIVLDLLK